MSNVSDCVQVHKSFHLLSVTWRALWKPWSAEICFPTNSCFSWTTKTCAWLSLLRINDYLEADVPVPSSDHVAEIVGKRGCKILFFMDATKAKIVTPRRDEQPIFKVSGDQFAVDAACKLIVEAAEQFSKIQEVRQFEAEMDPIGSALPSNTFFSDVVWWNWKFLIVLSD